MLATRALGKEGRRRREDRNAGNSALHGSGAIQQEQNKSKRQRGSGTQLEPTQRQVKNTELPKQTRTDNERNGVSPRQLTRGKGEPHRAPPERGGGTRQDDKPPGRSPGSRAGAVVGNLADPGTGGYRQAAQGKARQHKFPQLVPKSSNPKMPTKAHPTRGVSPLRQDISGSVGPDP